MRDALGFLTTIPVRGGPPGARAVALFPAVGAVVGAGWVLAAGAGDRLGGPLVAAALVLVVDLLLTGGLHLDGLADTADGLASRRPPDQVREVLKDPRIGAVGAAALGTGLLLRFALLASLVGTPVAPPPGPVPLGGLTPTGDLPLAGLVPLAAAPVVGRCTMVFLLAGRPGRRDSLAAGPAVAARPPVVVAATVLTAAIVALATGPAGVPVATVAAGVATVTVNRWRRRLGDGGDTVGTGGILAELATLAGLLALR